MTLGGTGMLKQILLRTAMVAAVLVVAPVQAQDFRTVTLMSWNVENLFDTVDDPNNPFDNTYLPRSVKQSRPDHEEHCRQHFDNANFRRECIEVDWTEEKLKRKLQAIGDVIRAVQPRPDVIILPELENPAILKRLNTEFLAGLGYTTEIELDSTVTDLDRGIDVGILSRLPLAGPPVAHKVDFRDDKDLCRATLGITEARLQLPDGKTLNVYAVHFPSGGNPLRCREHAFRTLNALSNALPEDAVAAAGGDLNFPCNEAQGDLFARMVNEGRWNAPPESHQGMQRAGLQQVQELATGRRGLVHVVVPRLLPGIGQRDRGQTKPVRLVRQPRQLPHRRGGPVQIETTPQGFVSPRLSGTIWTTAPGFPITGRC